MYILECSDGSYYTGSTKDLDHRLWQHQNGEGANHTKKRLPVKLVYVEEFDRIDEAFYREKQVQGWSRRKKEALINGEFDKLPALSKSRTAASVPSTSSGTVLLPVVEPVPSTSSGTVLLPVVEPVPSTNSGTQSKPVVEPAETTSSGTETEPVVEPAETTLTRYPTYKDSGVEWLGEIPEGWVVNRLKSQIDFLTGFPFQSDKYSDSGVKLARGINVKEGVFNWDDIRYWNALEKHLIPFQLREDDILIGMDGSKVGKNFCIVKNRDLPILLLQRVARLRVRDKLEAKYLYWNIASINFLLWVNKSKTDPMVPHIAPKDIKDFIIPFPPLPTQITIANFLDNKTTKIDTAIAQKEKMIRLLQERKQIIIQQAVTKGLDPTVKMKDSGVEWIGEIPEGWEVTQIKKVAFTTSGSTPPSGNIKDYYNGHIPWVRTTDLNNDELIDVPEKITEKALRDTACKLVPRNTVCIAMYGGPGTIGKHSILRFEGTLNQALCGILPSKRLDHEYLYFYIKFYRPHWMIVAKGSRVDPNISQDEVRKMYIPIPPLVEQTTIVLHIESQLAKIDQAITLQQTQIEKLKEYKATLINSAVTGKIKVV